MARTKIENLNNAEELTQEEMKGICGGYIYDLTKSLDENKERMYNFTTTQPMAELRDDMILAGYF